MENIIIMYNPITDVMIPHISEKQKKRWEELGFVMIESPKEFKEKQAS